MKSHLEFPILIVASDLEMKEIGHSKTLENFASHCSSAVCCKNIKNSVDFNNFVSFPHLYV